MLTLKAEAPLVNPYSVKLLFLTQTSVGNGVSGSCGTILDRTLPLHLVTYDDQHPINSSQDNGYWYIDSKSIDIIDYSTNQSIGGMKFFSILPKKKLKINNKVAKNFNNKNIKTFNEIDIMSGLNIWSGTDLTGTSWVLNNNLSYTSDIRCFINFTSNSTNFNVFFFFKFSGLDVSLDYSDTRVYYGSWNNEAYKTISITGGADATNNTLINWLQNNATLISW